jgi:alpha-tubulin suppressor-like RCC1 family protein
VGALDVGHKHSCALDDDGGLWCWGGTDQGGTLPPVRAQSSARWRSVATGEDHTCAIRDDGSLSCWMNRPGGASEEADAMRIDDANDWRSVSAGLTHTCALRNDRSLWCWGAAELCGIGMSEGTVGLTRVGTRSDWDLLVVERDHACATTTDGDVFCWGSASDRGPTGQIGVVLVPTIVLFD